ncbi:MAG TPA: CocE/NonD family hydrolase [Pyrinomonadaceae bacterium]|nr:CocE/NonD family hydrolase [Pyrinomonadaceae bacterium]
MKFKSAFFVFTIMAFCCVSSAFAQTGNDAKLLAEYIKENYTKREVSIPMRDGVKLFTAIYEPKDRSQKYPILLNRTPYSVAPYGADKFKGLIGPNELFAREGYIFVYQDVRGRMMSEGEFEDVRPDIDNKTAKDIDESTDTYDTIDWLIKNVQNNNGRVGTYGISYPGFYTSAGSIDSHPALKACSPQAPVSDWFHGDDMHHNGALFLSQNYSFFGFFGQPRPGPVSNASYFKQWKGRETEDGYDFFKELGGLKEVADSYQNGYGFRPKFWDAMMAHPNYDDWWKARNILPKLKNIGCATMTVGGWYDNEDLYGALKTYQAIERQNPKIPFNVLVVGPWFHGGWERSEGDWLGTAYFGQKTSLDYRKNIELPFFDHFLKDKGDISNIKEVNLFDTGSHEWKAFSDYNPTNGIDTALYLTANGGLTFSQDALKAQGGFDEYVSDPSKPVPYTQKITQSYPRDFMTEDQRFASTRPDVLVYQTEVLNDDVTVAGDIKPYLFISSSGTDSDFVVKLIDVFPDDYKFPETGKKLPNGEPERVKPPAESAWSVFEPGGYQMLLRGEPMPARFRNSFEKPEPLKANEVTKLEYTMPGVAHTFKKGHRIMVQIQSTWFPLVARNPQKFVENYKTATAADFQKATERVYYGGKTSSMIVLPIMKK